MIYYHTKGNDMSTVKIAITIQESLLDQVDRLVREGAFPNRSRALQVAVEEKLARMNHGRLARECAKLSKVNERSLAEEGWSGEVDEWPEY
jgi:Arc/MetJ-type ribon-helix-helix transcriptional regulator